MSGAVIARLRHRVTLQRATETIGDEGDIVQAFAAIGQTWAEVKPFGGREIVTSGNPTAVQGWRVEMWHRTDLTTVDRILYGDLVLNIRSIADPDGKRVTVVAMCDTGAVGV